MQRNCKKCGGKIIYNREIVVETYKTKEKNLDFVSRFLLTLFTFGIGNIFVPKYANKKVAIWKYSGKCEKCGKRYEYEVEPDEPYTCEDCEYYSEFDNNTLWCDHIVDYVDGDYMLCERFELDSFYDDDYEDEEEEE